MDINQRFSNIKNFIQRKKLMLSLVLGCLVVAMWTLVRFFDLPTIYDMVTQQLIARSWLHGIVSPIQMGPTNYLFKVLFVYLPLQLLPGSPRLHIIVSTLVINLATFLLLIVVLRRLISELAPKIKPNLYLSALWLSLVAGSVFWIQFANSRNIEVVGGCFLIELVVRFSRRSSNWLGSFIVLFSALLFFADPLQIYMTALPTVVFLYLSAKNFFPRRVILTGLLLGIGVLGSKLIFKLFTSVFKVTFIGGSRLSTHWTLKLLLKATLLTVREIFALIAGKSVLGRVYQVIMVVIIGVALYSFVRSVISGYIPRKIATFIATLIIVDTLVYTLSGQSLQPGTSRYLIMIVPALMIILAVNQDVLVVLRHRLRPMSTILTILIFVCLLSLIVIWHPSRDSDGRLRIIKQTITSRNYKYVYGSMDTALPLDYYINLKDTVVTALACGPNGLIMSLAKPQQTLYNSDSEAAIIFDQSRIANYPFVCSTDKAKMQLGEPIRYEYTGDGSQVLIYPNRLLTSTLSR